MRSFCYCPIYLLLISLFVLAFGSATAQVTLAFQGGEPGDTWTYTSTGASSLADGEATQAPNKVTGTRSIVVGGNTGGGNCWAGGSGNGPATARTFTFNAINITSSNESVRTLRFNWGNRYPACSGTGWDGGEDLYFTPYHDGVAQPTVMIAPGNNNQQYSIQSNQHVYQVPTCVNSFSFVVYVTTNRADELLFLDNVTLSAPQLNGSTAQPSPITGPVTVCQGSTETYSVTASGTTVYTWSGLPAGASFTTPNGTNSISVNWGTAAPGTYTLTVTPSGICGGTGPARTLDVTIQPAPVPVTISGPTTFCAGETITLTSSYATGNVWSTTATTASINVSTAGTYTVNVLTACGTISDQHTVTIGSGPTIQNTSVTDVSCFGEDDGAITITTNGTNPEYSLDGTNWQSASSFTGLIPGTYTIYVRETTGGCTSTGTATVNEPQELIATAANDGPHCPETAFILQGNSNVTGVTYAWSGPNGYTSINQNPADVTEAGVYTLIISMGGCSSNPVTTTVVINSRPVAATSNNGPYCAGQPIVLNGTSDVTPATYSWSGPGGYASTQQNPTDATAGGNYSLVVTANGCSSLPSGTTVVVNPLPDASATYNSPYCSGNNLLLNGASTAVNPTYSWTGPGGYTSTVQNPTDAPGAGTYTLIVSQNGCNSLPVMVTVVEQLPVVTVSNTGPYCPGESILLQSTTSGVATPTYSWAGPGGYSSAVSNPTDATQSGIYTLTVSENNCSVSVSTVVTVHEAPSAAFDANTVCEGHSTTFFSNSAPGGQQTITDWSWNFGDGQTSAQPQNVLHTFLTSGSYPVTLTIQTNAGCTATVTNTITVSESPRADFYSNPGTVSDIDPVVQFINNSQGADSYEWVFENGDVLTETSPQYTFTPTGGNYRVLLIAYNAGGCSDSVYKILASEHVVLYYVPNAFTPDGDEYNNTFQPVFTQGFDPTNYAFRIFDRWGELIFESNDPASGWDGTFAGSAVASGTYTWQIRLKHRETDEWEEPVGHLTLVR